MAVNVVTEFGANTKKFDSAVEKSSKKAQKNLENIGKGARVASGAMGELVEKFNNLATGGKLGLIAAGLGVIFTLIKKIVKASDDAFERSVKDLERMNRSFKVMRDIRVDRIGNSSDLLSVLEDAATKDSLTNKERVEVQKAIDILQRRGELSNSVKIENGSLVGFNAKSNSAAKQKIIQKKIYEIDDEINALQKEAAKQQEGSDRKMRLDWKAFIPIYGQWQYFKFAPEEAKKFQEKKQEIQDNIAKLIAERNKLIRKREYANKEAVALEADIAAEKKKKLEEEQRKKKLEEEQRKKKLEEEQRAQKLKELNEKRAGISFLAGGSSQMFTNSLTSRGGWAGGGKIWDTNRFQQQILQYNAQQQATLLDIEKQIEELQRI